MAELRRWIYGLVIAGSAGLVLTLFVGGIWGVLSALGDESGAEVARGATAIIAVSLLMTHFLLVTLLALAVLKKNME